MKSEIEKIINEIETTHINNDEKTFSQKGFDNFKAKVTEFIASLYNESLKTTIRHKSDVISENHVELASTYLIKIGASKFSKFSGIIGGTFLGGTISNIFALLGTNQQLTQNSIVVNSVLGIIGGFLVAIHIMND